MDYVEQIRSKKPLIHHLTNWVTIYDCAQMTRSVGALPVMAHAPEEVEDMVKLASALVLNIGTLTSDFVAAQILAAKGANQKGIPVVLDIVGCGATPFRTEKTKEILDKVKVDIIKGNKGEISALAGVSAEVRGVESIVSADNIDEVSRDLSANFGATIVATGEVDYISDSSETKECAAGHKLMGEVVGTGCMAASVLGCFAAVAEGANYLESSFRALDFYGKAAERAAEGCGGPMDFKLRFFDEVAV